jgi:hypothetical protein
LIIVKDGYIYWSQGSATNSGVTGHDNGGGGNQHDIACEPITLSQNVWSSGDGHFTSGFSNHGVSRPRREGARFRGRDGARHVHRRYLEVEDHRRSPPPGRAGFLGLLP